MSIIFRIALWNTCFTKFFVESRDLFFERLGVVRTRVDQANSKGSGGLRLGEPVAMAAKNSVLLGSDDENVVDILSSECV